MKYSRAVALKLAGLLTDASARRALASLALLQIILFAGGPFAASAQNEAVVESAQEAVRQRVLSGRRGEVIFPRAYRAETYFVSNAQTGVRGKGQYARDNNSTPQIFSYEAVVNTRNGNVEKADYRFEGGDGASSLPSWMVGTFRGKNPQSGVRITLTVSPTGEVVALYDNGGQDKGTYADGQIQFGRTLTWAVRKDGKAFKATSGRRTEKFKRLS